MKRFCRPIFLVGFLWAGYGIAGDNPLNVHAVRVTAPPRIDGNLDEPEWKFAVPASDFIQRDPEEGQPGSERSEIRVLYDDEAIYFGCMYYDAEPGKIVSRLSRRDDEPESDGASIRIDSYHDHQTGYEFTYNVAGVKKDVLQYDDANREDDSWDPVWELQARITPQGWIAEIKIPFHILRYRSFDSDSSENVWGINFLRYISRKKESERWAFTPKSQSGFISRYGHLRGLKNLPEPRQLEALPFVTSKQSYDPASVIRDRRQEFLGNAGVDLRYGITSNFSIDATVNPDFGQVEADPAVLNLSAFETFYPEKRPFFVDGTQIIRFSTFGGDLGPGMFYSRRIGRAISESEVDVPSRGKIVDIPKATTILAAAKVTGKTNEGLAIGILEAITQEERARVVDSAGTPREQTLEPFAHYNIIRMRKDVMNNSNIGMILTTVAKDGRAPAFTNGYDWSLKFDNNTYALDGFLALSSSMNSDGDRIYGSAGKLNYRKNSGEHWLWALGTDFTSKRYNINDVGFFFSPNDFGEVFSLTYKEDVPADVVRNYAVGMTLHYRDNFDGANLFRAAGIDGSLLFSNYWLASASVSSEFGFYDPYETRGYGLYRKPVNYGTSLFVVSDERHDISLRIGQRFGWDSKSKHQWATTAGINVKPSSWMDWSVESQYQIVRDQEAWFTTTSSGEALFGDRSTDQLSVTLRGSITFTRDLTLQIYGQEFFATAHFDNIRKLVGTSDFVAYNYNSYPNFDRRSFNSNIVLRWEYLPASILYLVWSQAREGENVNYLTSFGNNVDGTFQIPPSNVLLLKVSYWLHL